MLLEKLFHFLIIGFIAVQHHEDRGIKFHGYSLGITFDYETVLHQFYEKHRLKVDGLVDEHVTIQVSDFLIDIMLNGQKMPEFGHVVISDIKLKEGGGEFQQHPFGNVLIDGDITSEGVLQIKRSIDIHCPFLTNLKNSVKNVLFVFEMVIEGAFFDADFAGDVTD
jgi:hypothetical protein